jgi:hypothetical protein
MPEIFCLSFLLLKNYLVVQCILFFDAIIILRFVLIICMKSPQNFQDDFWYSFINIQIAIFRFLKKVVCLNLLLDVRVF